MMDIICNWEFIDKDTNRKWTGASMLVFACSFLAYGLLKLYSEHPGRYTHIAMWFCIIACIVFFFSIVPRFSWKKMPIHFRKTNDDYLVISIEDNILEHGVLLDCKYIFSDYAVFLTKQLGDKMVNIRGLCVAQYMDDGQIVGTEEFLDKCLEFKITKEQLPVFVEYFQL